MQNFHALYESFALADSDITNEKDIPLRLITII